MQHHYSVVLSPAYGETIITIMGATSSSVPTPTMDPGIRRDDDIFYVLQVLHWKLKSTLALISRSSVLK